VRAIIKPVTARQQAEELLAQLPALLAEVPELRRRLYLVLDEHYVTRDEMKQVLDEIRELRAQGNRIAEEQRRIAEEQRRIAEEQRRLAEELRALREDTNRRFDEAAERDRDTRDWVGVVVGGFQVRAGRCLEDAVAGALRVALGRKHLDAESVKLRQRVVDTVGRIGPAGRSYEYDILVTNGRACIFEVKSTAKVEEVDRFADICGLVAMELDLVDPEPVIITLAKTPELAERCRERGVVLA
jgi:hypothetical protein